MDSPNLASGFIYYVVFLFSTTLHEAAHAWAAKLGGDLTAYHGGQVSLDPRPHVLREPVGMVILPILSTLMTGWPIGFASAPYDPLWALRHPRRAAVMAIAGPASNLLLVVLAVICIRMGVGAGVFHAPETAGFTQVIGTDQSAWRGTAFVIGAFFSMNLVMVVLNLLPFPPLDGSAVVTLLMKPSLATKYQEFLMQNPILGLAGMVAAWRLLDVVFHPIFWAAVAVVYPEASYTTA